MSAFGLLGPADQAEVQDDAVITALHDQTAAGLDVVTDGEQTRLDFNLSFYGHFEGIELEFAAPDISARPRTINEGNTESSGTAGAPRGLGAARESCRPRRIFGCVGNTLRRNAQGQCAGTLYFERQVDCQ